MPFFTNIWLHTENDTTKKVTMECYRKSLWFITSLHLARITSVGRCAVHRQRSLAMTMQHQQKVRNRLQSVRPTCCEVFLSDVAMHCCLLSSLRLDGASTAGLRAEWAKTCSGSRRLCQLAEHCHAPSSDTGYDVLFFCLVQYCSVDNKVITSYAKDSSLARHVECFESPLICL